MKSTARLSLAVQYASTAEHCPTRAQFRRWIKIAMLRDAQITLRIVDEDEGRELNRMYRDKDYATNVLTFGYDDDGQTQSGGEGISATGDAAGRLLPPLCGDVAICAPVVEREAAAQHKELLAHYAHLVIHAALHLQGYEHENDHEALEMETLETALMLKLRYPDPYQPTSVENGCT